MAIGNKPGIKVNSTNTIDPLVLLMGIPPMGTKMLTAPSVTQILNGRNGRTAAITTISGSGRTAIALTTMYVITVGSAATKHGNAVFMARKATRGLSS